jgi:hypothetical protein
MADAVPRAKTAYLVAAVHPATRSAAPEAVTIRAQVNLAAEVWDKAAEADTIACPMGAAAKEPSPVAAAATIQGPKYVVVEEAHAPSLQYAYLEDAVPRA